MSEPARHLDEARRRAAAALLRLTSPEELERIAAHLEIAPPADHSVIIEQLATVSRFEAVSVLLHAARSTVLMLRDIVQFLERHGVSARTTGCALFLADPMRERPPLEVDLSPQAAGVICDWKAPTLRRLGDDPFRQAREIWNQFVPDWRRLLSKASPQVRRGQMDVVRTAINMRSGSPTVAYRPDNDVTDYGAQAVLEHLLEQVEQVREALERAPAARRSASHVALIEELDELVQAAEASVFDRSLRHRRREPHARRHRELKSWEAERHVTTQFLESFDLFCEDVLALGDAVEGDQLFDLVAANLWTSRPQLYEVWLLVSLLGWLEHRGYEVELLKLSRTPTGRCEWRLSYAKDKTPCARLRGQPSGGSVFYQLYRPSGDMPDLCFIPTGSGTAQPLWAVDAKHSAAGGYGLSNYRSTAERYRDSFGAKLSAVVEYFPRPDLVAQNPNWFGPRAALITDAAPGAAGLDLLMKVLEDVHPARSRAIVCVDVSQSFSSAVGDIVEAVCGELVNAGDEVLDSFICFAGRATTRAGMQALVTAGSEAVRTAIAGVAGGLQTDETLIEPLLLELRHLIDVNRGSRVIIVGDGAFSDCTADPIATIQSRLGVPVSIRSTRSSLAC